MIDMVARLRGLPFCPAGFHDLPPFLPLTGHANPWYVPYFPRLRQRPTRCRAHPVRRGPWPGPVRLLRSPIAERGTGAGLGTPIRRRSALNPSGPAFRKKLVVAPCGNRVGCCAGSRRYDQSPSSCCWRFASGVSCGVSTGFFGRPRCVLPTHVPSVASMCSRNRSFPRGVPVCRQSRMFLKV